MWAGAGLVNRGRGSAVPLAFAQERISSASVDSIWSCICADQFVLAHPDMVERLGIAVGERLQVGAVEHAPARPAWRGSLAARWCWRWSRRPAPRRPSSGPCRLHFRRVRDIIAAVSGRARQNWASLDHSRVLSANGRVLAALDDGRSIKLHMWRRRSDQLVAHAGGGRAVERDRRERGEIAQQPLDPVVLGEPDRLVETTWAVRRADHVPQPDPAPANAASRSSYPSAWSGSPMALSSSRQNWLVECA